MCRLQPEAVSLDVKTGQMLMVGFRGLSVTGGHTVIGDISERHVGGVVLFDYDVPGNRPCGISSLPSRLRRLLRA